MRVWLLAILIVFPGSASAHLVSTRFGDLYSGLLHPLTSLAHIVPWLALGLFAGLQGRESARWILLYFPLSVCIGALLAAWLPELGFINYLNVFSIVVLGMLVALALTPARSIFIGLIILVGLSHGYANGSVELAGRQQLLYVIGVTTAAYILVTLVTGLSHVMAHHSQWSKVAVRTLGSWIAAIGFVFGGFTLFGGTA